jgi:6-phosphogluconolactonase (cycloisomerase 2 family)
MPLRLAPTPISVEEQYEPAEAKTLATSTTETHYDIVTPDPKAILLMALDQDHIVEFNRPTDTDSTPIKADGSLTITGKGIRQIYAKTVTGTGRLHIRVWKR